MDSVTTGLGLRERKKAHKLDSIKRAARELFATRGFNGLTMREVARVADVGFGTISAYATDKAGLLAMLFVEELGHFPPVFEDVDPKLPLIEQLLLAFTRLFSFWARHPDLSRAVLPQLQSKNTSSHVEAILRRRAAVLSELAAWIEAAKVKKRVISSVNSEQAAETLFALYTSTIHEWLMSEPVEIESGVARLRYLFELPVSAMAGKAPLRRQTDILGSDSKGRRQQSKISFLRAPNIMD